MRKVWTIADDKQMRAFLRKGLTVTEVAARMDRSYRSVESRMRRLRDVGELSPLTGGTNKELRTQERAQSIASTTNVVAAATGTQKNKGLGQNPGRVHVQATGEADVQSGQSDHEAFRRIVSLAKQHGRKGGLNLETLCDALRLSPAAGRDLVSKAIEAGYNIDIAHGKLDFRPPTTLPPQEVRVTSAEKFDIGDEISVGVVSDPHFASKHHESDSLKRHLDWLRASGVKHIFGPGDWVAGDYRFLKYEITHTGIEDQSRLVTDFIKEYGPDFDWWTIAGNHDESFNAGIDAAKMIEQQLKADGFNGFHYLGARAGLVRLYNTRFALHHPGGGLGYAISYKLQKYVDETPAHRKAQFLFSGHSHQQLYMRRSGCHAFMCGTFENGDSAFGRMLGGDISVGSWLVRYRLDAKGAVASVSPEFRSQAARSLSFVSVPEQIGHL